MKNGVSRGFSATPVKLLEMLSTECDVIIISLWSISSVC